MVFLAELPPVAADPESVRRLAERVLAGPEYAGAQPTWWQRGLQLLAEGLARILELLGAGDRGPLLGTVVLVAVCAAVAVMALRFLRRVEPSGRATPAAGARVGRPAAAWWDDAAEARRHGRWREALRASYRGLVAELAAAGLVEEVPGRTTGEYVAAVSDSVPDAAAAFRAATRRFEAVWYGQAAAGVADLEAFEAAAAEVRARARLRVPASTGASA